jgi:CubicO group peptidase (beta-lactamase class C family)
MTIQDFIKKLQDATNQQFWKNPPEKATFKAVLDQYAIYYAGLSSAQLRLELSNFFWAQVKKIGTPIIEERSDGKCEVYFLFPKNELINSNDLYLQGEFHGYGGKSERNKLDELSNTGIMYRSDSIPINGIIVYQYQQEDGPLLNDVNSSHRNVYHGYAGQFIFRVNPIQEFSRLGKKEEENYWNRIVSSNKTPGNKHFYYQASYYSDSSNKLHTCDVPLPKKVDIFNPVPDNLHEIEGEDLSASPYANFTRAVYIFKPNSNKIEKVIVINDGRPYILAGIMDQFERMVNAGRLSANTAFVLINPLQTLAKTMPSIERDERFKMPGMGVRIIDFDKGIDNYIIFLKHLFAQLGDIGIPNDPRNRIMVGASLSGTASIYIAFKAPELFNGFIAQSPSPSNDAILKNINPNQETNIQLSCGFFEQSCFNDGTDCLKYVNELSKRMGLQFNQKLHGHNPAAWVIDLNRSLPAVLRKNPLQKIIESAHIPAVGYAYVEPTEESKQEFESTSITFGKKTAQSTDAVDGHTRFPASSLSKIVFTYLVLQLVKAGKIALDEPLHKILQYERFKVDGKYPKKAEELTAQDVLSHTTGLPNLGSGSDLTSTLSFAESKLGEEYSYSGEAFLYLQKVVEKKMEKDLETLAQEYVFKPLGMDDSTFLPQPEEAYNIVAVYTELGKRVSIYESLPHLKYELELMSSSFDLSKAEKGKIYLSENPRKYYVKGMSGLASIPPEIDLTNLATKLKNPSFRSAILAITSRAGHTPHLNAAGSLLTTAHDFSKFMAAWLNNMDDPIFKQAFEPRNAYSIGKTCGLGWHIYKNKGEIIAYQYGENPNTRAFVAINITTKKGAAFFANSKNGESIANQLLNSPAYVPIGDLQEVFKELRYSQSDQPGWQETLEGKIAEDQATSEVEFEKAKNFFEKALKLAPEDKSKQLRLEWFTVVHQQKIVTASLKTFEGKYKNPYNDEVEIFIHDNSLIYKQLGQETKLVQISETDFLPEKDQSFTISFKNDQMSKLVIQGDEYTLFKGYDLALMSVPSFNKLDTNKLGEKPYLIKDEYGKYKIWGCKERTWQLSDMHSLKLPFKWEPSQTVFISSRDEIFDTLKKGHTLSTQPLPASQEATTSYAAIARSLGHQPALAAQTKPSDTPESPLSKKEQLNIEKPIEVKKESQEEPSKEHEEEKYHQPKIS